MSRIYRRLTANERQYLIDNYDDDPQTIAQIAAHLQLETNKILDHARYLNLKSRSSRRAWSQPELELLDDFAETQPRRIASLLLEPVSTKRRQTDAQFAIAGKETARAGTFPQTLRRLLVGISSSKTTQPLPNLDQNFDRTQKTTRD